MKRYKYEILSGVTGTTFQVPIFLEGSVDEMGVMVGFDGEFEQIEQYANFTYKGVSNRGVYNAYSSGIGFTSSALACGNGSAANDTFYINPTYNIPTVGQYVYTDSELTTTWVGFGMWWHMQRLSDSQWFAVQIEYSGEILSVVACSPVVTPTPSITPSESPCPVNPSATPSITPTNSIPSTPTPTPSITLSPTPSVTQTPCPVSCEFSGIGEFIDCPSPTPTPTSTPSSTPSVSPSSTPVVSPSSTPVVSPPNTPSVTPTHTPSRTPSTTPSRTPTHTPSITPTTSRVMTTVYATVSSALTYDITAVEVDGDDILGGNVTPGNTGSGTFDLTGTFTVVVKHNGIASSDDSISLNVGGPLFDCQDDPGPTTTFNNVPFNGTDIDIFLDEVGC